MKPCKYGYGTPELKVQSAKQTLDCKNWGFLLCYPPPMKPCKYGYGTPAARAIWRDIVAKKRKHWKEEFDASLSPSAWDITKRHVVHLVEEMEQAYQYIEMKDFLLAPTKMFLLEQKLFPDIQLEDSIDEVIAFILADDRFEKLKKLDTDDIWQAIMALYLGLKFKRHVVDAPSDTTNGLVYSEDETFEKNQLQMDSNFSNKPIFRLAHETLKMNYVLHKEPEEELKILKNKLHPTFYYDIFIYEEWKYKETTVTFAYDDCDASQEVIKTSLSVVGEILSVRISRLNEQLHVAHVTFIDLTAAKNTVRLAAQGQLKLNDRPVTAVLTSYNKPRSDLPAPMLQYATAAVSALEKLDDGLFKDARNKYATLVEKANRRKMDNKRKRNSVLSGDLESVLPDDMQFV